MWSKLYSVMTMGFGTLMFLVGLFVALNPAPMTVTRELNGVVTREYRPLRWWERLIAFGLGVAALCWVVVTIAPAESAVVQGIKWVGVVVATAASGGMCIAYSGWLMYARVFRSQVAARPQQSVAAVQDSENAIASDDDIQTDRFTDHVLAGDVVEETLTSLQGALEQNPGGAYVLALLCLAIGYHILKQVPSAIDGKSIDEIFWIFSAWEFIVGAAEAAVFLLLPVGLCVAVVVYLIKGSRQDAIELLPAILLICGLTVIAWFTGFLSPLLELVTKLR